jgi:predicted ester cyclase
MTQDSRAVVQRWFEEVWNQRLDRTIDELVTRDSVCFTDQGPVRGPEEFRERQYRPFVAAFPDLRVELEATLSEGDQVVVRWTATGRHDGEGLGFPPTQETVLFRGITWVHVREGKMLEGWQSSNIPEVIRTLAAKASA